MKIIRASEVKKIRDKIGNYKFLLDNDTVFSISFVEILGMVQDGIDIILEKIKVPKSIIDKAKNQIAEEKRDLSELSKNTLYGFIKANMVGRKNEKFKIKEFEKLLGEKIDEEMLNVILDEIKRIGFDSSVDGSTILIAIQ